VRARRRSWLGALLAAVLTILAATQVPVAAADPTPSEPGAGYVLDWENSRDWTVPDRPPPGWAYEYRPEVRHDDGEPQVRVADAARGEPVRAGQHSVRFDLDKRDPPLHNGSRAELGAEDPVEPRAVERWYGFSIFLPSSWVYDQAPEIVMQWHQVGGDCTRGCSPPLALITHKGQFWISQNWQNTHTPGDWTFSTTPIGAYETGRWIDWVVHVKWSTGSDGVLDIWKDGRAVTGFYGKYGRTDDFGDQVHGNYVVLGIYKWPWSQGKPSDTTRRVMYVDEVRTADARGSYEAVKPRSDTTTHGHLQLVSGITISPAMPTAGQPVTASFQVTNDGDAPVSVGYFLAGNRDQTGANRDFPASPTVTLQPGETYTYEQSRVLAAGSYTAWPAYYDGVDWDELGTHITFTVS
jgi:Polysaccharide lyase